jgi:hypothetical protein
MCDMVSPGKRKCVVGDEGELVECAGDLGNEAEEAAMTHQLVRESGSVGVSVSVRRSQQATLAYTRGLVVGSPACGFVQMGWQPPCVPVCPGHPSRADQPQATPSRAPSRASARRRPADICRRELSSGKGMERRSDLDVALVREREHVHETGFVGDREGSQANASEGMGCGPGEL